MNGWYAIISPFVSFFHRILSILYCFLRQVRPCMIYKDEYDDCISVKARFHQYFIFGKLLDCDPWKIDYRNCYQWQKHKSEEAYVRRLHFEDDASEYIAM